MKKHTISTLLKTTLFSLITFCMSVSAFAQIDIDVDLGKQEWYEKPIVWAGVAVFVLILALILRRGKK